MVYPRNGITQQHMPEMQLACFGLSLAELKSLDGKVLDFGCGKDANLVSYLRSHGIAAEGIDPALQQEADHLMKKEVSEISPLQGCIPRPDNTYQLIVSNMVNPLITAFSVSQEDNVAYCKANSPPRFSTEIEQEMTDLTLRCTFAIMELTRVLAPTGRYICFPSLSNLNNACGGIIDQAGYTISREKTGMHMGGEELIKPIESLLGIDLEEVMKIVIEAADYRTVIKPKPEQL